MPAMPWCASYVLGKNYAGEAYRVGDEAHCVYCGRRFIVATVEPDGRLQVPAHRYPTKAEIRAWRRN